jgi:hypothetical protein
MRFRNLINLSPSPLPFYSMFCVVLNWRSCFLCKKLICFAMWFTIVHACKLLHVSIKISLRVTRIKHGFSLDMAIETVHCTMSLVPDFLFTNCIYSNYTTPKSKTVLFDVCLSQQRQVLFVTSTRTSRTL